MPVADCAPGSTNIGQFTGFYTDLRCKARKVRKQSGRVRESPGESGVRPGKASHVLVPDFPGLPGLFPDFSRGFSQIYTDLSRKGEKSKNSPEECRKGVSR